ncbi:TetR/AcrR family transcriptional regulator [Mucilaginibacter glaciei]|uniref:TetR/AcrR family transcriptional regulator n=1 Tax=Mucilaginibacter glaciei TaxID=2772109 RepID=A0A926S6Y5_9SPHI|nr:TetR/AcrR family transcriptional regulator [Mucilaginibacter glaciei]MBD1394166.1 TetR/AcrR family transcriptional regulator [Mucilaginibacter glaciei]
MTTANRKLKEKEELKALILDSAKKLFLIKGVEQTTIRSIAQHIDYSVGTVYVYFKDKNAILNELHIQGFAQLSIQFEVLRHVANPMERLIAMGRLYIEFAMANPEMYELMFTLKAPMEALNEADDEEWKQGINAFTFLKATVLECISTGHFKGHQPDALTFMIWSLVHGMCSLHISNRITGVRLDNAAGMVPAGFEEFILILKKL